MPSAIAPEGGWAVLRVAIGLAGGMQIMELQKSKHMTAGFRIAPERIWEEFTTDSPVFHIRQLFCPVGSFC